MHRRRADLEIATRPNTEEAQQSAQSQRQNHNHATPTDAVSCKSNRNSNFLRCMISSMKYMLVMSIVLPFHQVIKLLCNANWNMKTHPQLLMPLGLHGVHGEVATWHAGEGWDPYNQAQLWILYFTQTQDRSRACNLAQNGGSTAICTSAETESQSCNTNGCRESTRVY